MHPIWEWFAETYTSDSVKVAEVNCGSGDGPSLPECVQFPAKKPYETATQFTPWLIRYSKKKNFNCLARKRPKDTEAVKTWLADWVNGVTCPKVNRNCPTR